MACCAMPSIELTSTNARSCSWRTVRIYPDRLSNSSVFLTCSYKVHFGLTVRKGKGSKPRRKTHTHTQEYQNKNHLIQERQSSRGERREKSKNGETKKKRNTMKDTIGEQLIGPLLLFLRR